MKNKIAILPPSFETIAAFSVLYQIDNNIDFMFTSNDRAEYTFNKLTSIKKSTIYIIGLDINKNNLSVLKHLKAISENKNNLIWISNKNIEKTLKQKLQKYSCEYLLTNTTSIPEFVSRYFEIDSKKDYLWKGKIVNTLWKWDKDTYNLLIDYAMFQFKNMDDRNILSNTVLKIANGDNIDEDVKIANNSKNYFELQLIGYSEKNKRLKEQIQLLGEDNFCRVLIYGETGTGKEIIANLIHAYSERKSKPFIPFNCSLLDDQLVESRLFGYVKGAFTGANADKNGIFEDANGGTLFLDEISELSYSSQAKLLRVLQEKKINKLGSTKEIDIDIRILCATNKDIKKLITNNQFREDLYYRLATYTLYVEPLRDKKYDIPDIANSLLFRISSLRGKPMPRLTNEQKEILINYHWSGNIRELEHVLEAAFVITKGKIETFDFYQYLYKDIKELPIDIDNPNIFIIDVSKIILPLEKLKADYAELVFNYLKQNYTLTANKLEIAVNTLKKLLKS